MISMKEDRLLLTKKLLNQGFLVVNVNVSNFMVAIVTWLTVTEYMYHICPRICPDLLSSSGEETDYHSRVSELTQGSSCNSINTVDFSMLFKTTPH